MSEKEMTLKEFMYQYALGSLTIEDLKELAVVTTSKEILTILAKNKSKHVQARVYLNNNTPEEIRETLKNVPFMFSYVSIVNPGDDVEIRDEIAIDRPFPKELLDD